MGLLYFVIIIIAMSIITVLIITKLLIELAFKITTEIVENKESFEESSNDEYYISAEKEVEEFLKQEIYSNNILKGK